MRADILEAWRSYQANMCPESRNVFLNAMMEVYPPLPQDVPNPTDRIHNGKPVYPELHADHARELGYYVSVSGHYGTYKNGEFVPKGRVKP